MKDIISKISLTTLFLTYLFFCGILYLISFWSTFDFDITNYIELLDIPKSFVFPLATALGVSVFTIIIQAISRSYDNLHNPEQQKLETKTKQKSKLLQLILNWETWLTLGLFACLYFYKPRRDWVFATTGALLIVLCIIKSVNHPYFVKTISSFTIRLVISIFIFYIPIYSFVIGKKDSIQIWDNKRYFKVKQIVFKKDQDDSMKINSNKLLGKLGTNIFLSDSLNSSIIVLNMETIKSVEYVLVDKNAYK